MRCWSLWRIVLVLGLLPAHALAQSEQALTVLLRPCPVATAALDMGALLELSRVELMPRELVTVDSAEGASIVVDACAGDQVSLTLASSEPRVRTVALAEVEPAMRPRVAALALAELVHVPEPAPPPSPPPPSSSLLSPPNPAPSDGELPPGLRASPSEEASLRRIPRRFGVGVDTRVFGSPGTLLVGPRLGLLYPRFDVTALAALTRAESDDGQVRAGLGALSGSYVPFHTPGRVETLLALGAELGLTWGHGTNTAGDTQTRFAPYVSALVRGGLGVRTGRAYTQLSLNTGVALGLVVVGNGQAMTSTHGPFASLSLDIASPF